MLNKWFRKLMMCLTGVLAGSLLFTAAVFARTGVVTADEVFVRKAPSVKAELAGSLEAGDEVLITFGPDAGWYEIYLDGDCAFVSAEFIDEYGSGDTYLSRKSVEEDWGGDYGYDSYDEDYGYGSYDEDDGYGSYDEDYGYDSYDDDDYGYGSDEDDYGWDDEDSYSEDYGDYAEDESSSSGRDLSLYGNVTAAGQAASSDSSWSSESSSAGTGSSGGTYLGTFTLTAYCNCAICCGTAGNLTASGTVPTAGRTVAMGGVPFGTQLLINGVVYTVEDRGTPYGHVDIFCNSHSEALSFGRQSAEVYQLN